MSEQPTARADEGVVERAEVIKLLNGRADFYQSGEGRDLPNASFSAAMHRAIADRIITLPATPGWARGVEEAARLVEEPRSSKAPIVQPLTNAAYDEACRDCAAAIRALAITHAGEKPNE